MTGWISRIFRKGDPVSAAPQGEPPRPKPEVASGAPAPTARIAVGNCSSCGQPLRMKPHAVREVVRLTCKCGAANEIKVPPEILNSTAVTASKDARQPAPYEDPPEVKLIVESARRLLEIYTTQPAGFSRAGDGPLEREIRDIGRRLYEAGGDDLMFRAHEAFRIKCAVRGGPRNLENMWGGIGEWRG